ncbi:hypothetical protein SDJN02_22146, partial [Cucurbita argyrosperma subsp. argyrosperma]
IALRRWPRKIFDGDLKQMATVGASAVVQNGRNSKKYYNKVLSLSESFSGIKDVNLHLAATTSKELVEDPLKSVEQSKRWKIKSCYGDIGFQYRDDETIAYVASLRFVEGYPISLHLMYWILVLALVQLSEDLIKLNTQDIVPYQEVDPDTYDSDVMETETLDEDGDEGGEEQGD